MLLEERVFLNVLSAPNSKSPGGISREETGKDTTCLTTKLRSENEWVVENLLIHLIGVL